jgi:hypothetical protein
MPVNHVQVRADIAAVENALNTLQAPFTDPNYWSAPLQSIARARAEMESIRQKFSGGAQTLIDQAK